MHDTAAGDERGTPVQGLPYLVLFICGSAFLAGLASGVTTGALAAAPAARAWLNDAPLLQYILLLPGLVLVLGFGRRNVLLGALGMLLAGMVACGLVGTGTPLLAALAVMGAGVALVLAATIDAVQAQRARARWLLAWAVSYAVGSLVGWAVGLATAAPGVRVPFLLATVVTIAVLIVVHWRAPGDARPRVRFARGALLVWCCFVAASSFGIVDQLTAGWDGAKLMGEILSCLVAFIILTSESRDHLWSRCSVAIAAFAMVLTGLALATLQAAADQADVLARGLWLVAVAAVGPLLLAASAPRQVASFVIDEDTVSAS